jgi:SPX domain protein involved in polyphosphate accumulation
MPNLSHTIRKFNRFELKYIVSIQKAEQFKQALSAYLAPDEHGDFLGYYGVSSLYYDSPDYRFYWEKIDGIKFRRKLRIRHYENGDPLTEDTPVFVEIKQRLNRVTQKRRLQIPYGDALRLCNQRQVPEPDVFNHNPAEAAVMEEILALSWQYDLRPASVVSYARQALIGGQYDIGLRVTFDKDLFYRAAGEALPALQLNRESTRFALFPAGMVIIEIKVNERIPYWLTELVAMHNLNLMRVSKYCRSIELAQNISNPAWRFVLAG